jgi:predicted alpha/beta-hydrolase family hydrolase
VPAASIHAFNDDSAEPRVRGFLHQPVTPTGQALVLTHGAGSNAAAPLLIALADVFTSAGFTVLRCDLPYRQSRPYGPPGPGDAARDRAGLVNAIGAIKKMSERIFLGGHSYGGRQASMLCAEQPELVSGLLLLSYPLHPPRKPEQLRTQHLFHLRVPTLFVHGERDPFGTLAEIETALKLIPGKTKLLPIQGGGHDLGFKGKARRQDIPQEVLKEFINFL